MAAEFNIHQLHDQMQENFNKGMEFYHQRNSQKAIEYLQKALGSCEILNESEVKAEILYYLGHTYQMRRTSHDFQLAEDCYKDLLEMKGAREKYYSRVQVSRAVALVNQGEYERAVEIFNEIHGLQDSADYLTAYTTETYAYFCLGKFSDPIYYQEAIKYCEKLITVSDRTKNAPELYYAYHNLGHIYYEINENTKSMLSFQDGLEFCQDQAQRHESYVDMALVFIRLSQYDLARAYIDKAQHYYEKPKHLLGLAACLFAKGKLYRHKGRIEESTNYLELALSGYRDKEYYYGVVKTFYELYELHRKQSPEKAELYYDQYQFYMNYVSPMTVKQTGMMSEEEDPLWV